MTHSAGSKDLLLMASRTKNFRSFPVSNIKQHVFLYLQMRIWWHSYANSEGWVIWLLTMWHWCWHCRIWDSESSNIWRWYNTTGQELSNLFRIFRKNTLGSQKALRTARVFPVKQDFVDLSTVCAGVSCTEVFLPTSSHRYLPVFVSVSVHLFFLSTFPRPVKKKSPSHWKCTFSNKYASYLSSKTINQLAVVWNELFFSRFKGRIDKGQTKTESELICLFFY